LFKGHWCPVPCGRDFADTPERRENNHMEVIPDMTREEFRTIMEMVRMIIDGSKDKEDALKKIDSLTILKGNDKDKSE
jgi:hypothetical protein